MAAEALFDAWHAQAVAFARDTRKDEAEKAKLSDATATLVSKLVVLDDPASSAVVRRLITIFTTKPKFSALLLGEADTLREALFLKAGAYLASIALTSPSSAAAGSNTSSNSLVPSFRPDAARSLAGLLKFAVASEGKTATFAARLSTAELGLDRLIGIVLPLTEQEETRAAVAELLVATSRLAVSAEGLADSASSSPALSVRRPKAALLVFATRAEDHVGFKTFWQLCFAAKHRNSTEAIAALLARLDSVRRTCFDGAAEEATADGLLVFARCRSKDPTSSSSFALEEAVPTGVSPLSSADIVPATLSPPPCPAEVRYLPSSPLDTACLNALEEVLFEAKSAALQTAAVKGLGESAGAEGAEEAEEAEEGHADGSSPVILSALPLMRATDAFVLLVPASSSMQAADNLMLPAVPVTKSGQPLERSEAWLRVARLLLGGGEGDLNGSTKATDDSTAAKALWTQLLAFPTADSLAASSSLAPQTSSLSLWAEVILPRLDLLLRQQPQEQQHKHEAEDEKSVLHAVGSLLSDACTILLSALTQLSTALPCGEDRPQLAMAEALVITLCSAIKAGCPSELSSFPSQLTTLLRSVAALPSAAAGGGCEGASQTPATLAGRWLREVVLSREFTDGGPSALSCAVAVASAVLDVESAELGFGLGRGGEGREDAGGSDDDALLLALADHHSLDLLPPPAVIKLWLDLVANTAFVARKQRPLKNLLSRLSIRAGLTSSATLETIGGNGSERRDLCLLLLQLAASPSALGDETARQLEDAISALLSSPLLAASADEADRELQEQLEEARQAIAAITAGK